MKRPRSIRFRLAWRYLIALASGLILFAAAVFFSMQRSLLGETDRTLAERTHKLGVFLNRELVADPAGNLREELDEYAGVLPAGVFLQIRDTRGAVYFASAVDFPFPAANGAQSAFATVSWRNQAYRVLSQRALLDGDPYQIELAGSLETVEALLDRLRWLLFACIPAVILAAAAAGYWLSRRALRPVDEITAAARSIGIENLSERLIVPDTGDELERLSETWNGMLARLEAAVRQLSQFTADAAHELRTPLAVIRSTAELAARRPRTAAEYREALGRIVAESERMTQLVDDLLFLARCDSASTEMPLRTLDLARVVEAACDEVRLKVQARGIRLAVAAPDAGAAVSANEGALRRLVLGLLDNAIKYSNPGGEVGIGIARKDGGVSLEVRDTGIGISGPALPRIFTRFYRGEEARSAADGHGLGLSLAEEIARRHGARIEVASSPGIGSTFRVEFPAASDSEWRDTTAQHPRMR